MEEKDKLNTRIDSLSMKYLPFLENLIVKYTPEYEWDRQLHKLETIYDILTYKKIM